MCAVCVEVCLYMSCSSQAKVSSLEEELKETEAAFQRAQDQVDQLVCMYICSYVCVCTSAWLEWCEGRCENVQWKVLHWTCLSLRV